MSALDNAWNDRRTRIIILGIGALLVLGLVLRLAGVDGGTSGNTKRTDRYDLTQFDCQAFYRSRTTASVNDNELWAALVDCANAELLPAGANDPGYYR